MKRNKKPPKCCHPDCMNCPYVDCRYDRLEVEDYTESNKRDYEMHYAWTGEKLHKQSDKEYQNKRHTAYERRNRKYVDRSEYNKQYYAVHGEEIKQKKKQNYDTEQNTIKCRKYRKKHIEERKAYDKDYYEANKERKKAMARQRYYEKKKGEAVGT